MDIPRLFRQIRSRYKLLCATVGVRPSLRAADGSEENGEGPDRQAGLGLGRDDLGGGLDMDVDANMDTEVGRTPSATGRVATSTRTGRKKAAVWAVHDPRAERMTPGGAGGGGGGGTELSF